ncbi:diguanylate cyclase [Allorhizobium pseudoryzae]|uniref:GGDEF domain-containing protein n=1 Tax=Allorhizobium pseudoryzae TaxID=379684 RepID=UPI003D05232C
MIPTPATSLGAMRHSLLAKIFGTCFLAIHLPLIAIILYLGSGFSTHHPGPVLGVLLGATLAGTIACLWLLWRFFAPLRHLARAIEHYQAEGAPIRLQISRKDEIGTVTRAVVNMVAEVESLMKSLRHQASSDPLTGLHNRRWLAERIPVEQARAAREKSPLSAILFDLDHFKQINDRHGHDTGDHVLMAVSEAVRDSLRRYDIAARIGGEEFCLILPRTSKQEATVIAERLRQTFEVLVVKPLPHGRVTASFGVYEAASSDSMQQILLHADQALYAAKEGGRNRVFALDRTPV